MSVIVKPVQCLCSGLRRAGPASGALRTPLQGHPDFRSRRAKSTKIDAPAQKTARACEEFILFMQKAFPMAMRIGM